MRKLALSMAGALAFLAAAGGVVTTDETAGVTVLIPAQPISATATLYGSTAGANFTTAPISATETGTRTADASPGTISTFATGQVRFSWFSGCTNQPCGVYLEIPSGITVATRHDVGYVTLAAADFPGPGSSGLIPVRAKVAGPSGNAPAGAITLIPGNFGSLQVTNPKPIIGGATRQSHVVSQSDMQNAVSALTDQLVSKAQSELAARAGSDGAYALLREPDVAVKSDHAVGDEAASFFVTVTVALSATAYSDSTVRRLLTAKLRGQVPAGSEISSLPVKISCEVVGVSADAGVKVDGSAYGYALRALATHDMRRMLAHANVISARDALIAMTPAGTRIEISTNPAGMPWLPVIPARIAITLEPFAT